MRICLLATAIALVSCPSPGLAQTPGALPAPSLSVQGQGRVEVPPDYANVTVEVETRAKTAGGATSSHEARAARAYDAAKRRYGMGLDDLTTVLSAEQAWRGARTALTASRVTSARQAVQAFKALGGGWSPPQGSS